MSKKDGLTKITFVLKEDEFHEFIVLITSQYKVSTTKERLLRLDKIVDGVDAVKAAELSGTLNKG